MAEQEKKATGIRVEYAAGDNVTLRITPAEGGEIVIDFSPQDAGFLGRALISTSAVASSPFDKPEAGTAIADIILPLTQWETGRTNETGAPVLALDVAGGTRLVFLLSDQVATGLGQALVTEGSKKTS